MVLTATERATEIPPIRIPRMRQEANSTVAAEDRAACQIRTTAQHGIQRDLILTNKRTNTVALMPIGAKRKELPDSYDKNARFSVRMQIPLFMSSSYPFDANASSGRAGIFCGSTQTTVEPVTQRIHPPEAISPHMLAQSAPIHHATQTGYWERRALGCRSRIEHQPSHFPSK